MVYPAAWVRIPLAPPYGTLAQWSVPPAHNRSYTGSNPARSTKRAAASGDLSPSVTSGSKQKPSQANLTPITPLVKPCSSTALRLYPSAYPSRLGSLILINQFNCGGVIFSLVFRPSRRFIFRQSPWYLQAPPSRPPRIPLPGHTRKIEFPNMMSTFSSRCTARTCRLPGFYF